MSEDESSVDLSFLSEGESEAEEVEASKGAVAEGQVGTCPKKALPVSEVAGQQQQEEQQQANLEQPGAAEGQKQKKRSKVLSSKKVQRIKEQHRRRGILYMSRIPPHMKPAKIKQLLSEYGDLGRIYCKLEDASIRKQRIVKGGNTGKSCCFR